MEIKPNITDFSHELLCQILKYLPLREILSVAMLCKKMSTAVDMHLRLCKSIDFCQDAVCGYMPSTITDDHLLTLLKKCPHLEIVYGLHPVKVKHRRLRKRTALTIPGIIEALSLCFRLKAIETSDLRLFEAVMQHLPQLEIIGHFQNRDGLFPPQASQRLKLQPYPRISSLHLIGVEVPELTAMPHLQHLHLQCVRFTKLQPFRAFIAQNLKSFVMKHCIGPSVPQRYLSLIIALSSSPNLSHLELVRVPLLNGLFQRAVEDSYRHNGFVNLKTLVIAGCKGVLEADLGHLMIVSSKNLETLYIQPSLTKDSLFVSLSFAQCSFPKLQNLHLGYMDNLNSSGEWSNDALLSFGLAEVPDTPSSITDSGMKVISRLFPHIKTLSVSNCPHLMVMYQWMTEEDLQAWSKLTDLTLQKCHCLQLSSFALFLSFLPNVQVVILNDMFREPPKGCSHVGLSAGTGLGMSSAVVSNQDEHIAVQGHHQDFEHPGDEENEENEREFIDVENEDNPEPQFMVLQRDFFDGEDDDGAEAPMEEGQGPAILEPQNYEEQNVPENQLNNNSPSNENVINDSPKLSSLDDNNYDPSTSFAAEDQSSNGNKSNYNLRQSCKKLPSSKSVCIQSDILPEHICCSSNLKDENSVPQEKCDNNCCKPDDDVKVCVRTKNLQYNNGNDYDPHKPSTSKAGSHLDYLVTYNAKACDMSDSNSDSDYKCDSSTKRLKKSPHEQNFSKKVKKSTERTEEGFSSCLSKNSEKRPSCLSGFDSSCKQYTKLIKTCIIPITRCDEGIPYCKTSSSCAKTYSFKSEFEGQQPLKTNDKTFSIDKISFLEEGSKISENNMLESSSDTQIDFNCEIFSDNKIESSEIVINNAQKDFKEINSSVEREFSKNIKDKALKCENSLCYDYSNKIKCESTTVPESLSIDNKDDIVNASCCHVNKNTEVESKLLKREKADYLCVSNDINLAIINSTAMEESGVSQITPATNPVNLLSSEASESPDVKPCHIFVNDIACIPSHIKTSFDDQKEILRQKTKTKEEIPHNSSSEPVSNNCYVKSENENSYEDTSSESLKMYDPHQPSTSKAGIDVCFENTIKLSRTVTIIPSLNYSKNKGSSSNRKNKYMKSVIHVTVSVKKENVVNSTSKMENMKSMSENNNHADNMSDHDTEFSSAESKRLKKSHIKPHHIFVDNIGSIPLHTKITSSDQKEILRQNTETKKEIPHNSSSEPVSNNCYVKSENENSYKDTSSESSRRFDPYQPSTSKVGIDVHVKKKRNRPRFVKITQSPKDLKNETSSINTRSKYMNSICVSLKNENVGNSTSEMENIKSTSENNNHIDNMSYYNTELKKLPEVFVSSKNESEVNSTSEMENIKNTSGNNNHVDNASYYDTELKEFPEDFVASKNESEINSTSENNNQVDSMSYFDTELKKFPETFHQNDNTDDDTSYYVLVQDDCYRSIKIVNTITGEFFKPPDCSVRITQINNESYNKLQEKSKGKTRHKKCCSSKDLVVEQSRNNLEFNPYLPSTSQAGSHFDHVSENSNGVNGICYRCQANNRKTEKTLPSTTLKSRKKTIKTSSVSIKVDEKDKTKYSKNYNFKKCKCSCHHSLVSKMPPDIKFKILKIRKSDVDVLIKKNDSAKKNKFTSLEMPNSAIANNENCTDSPINLCRNQAVQSELDTEMNIVSKKCSKLYKKDDVILNSNNSSPSIERRETKSVWHTSRKARRKKNVTFRKRGKKYLNNSTVKSNSSCRHSAKSNSKRIPSVPMISLISQGTQATSADIRRSVRRIRRTTSRRRTVPPLNASKNPYSSKISAKMLNKRPVNTSPRPECRDKATSTSDPLLEDDAVQTLQLASDTLLSFTVVSCGISDLIIDRCPRLFHIEVQACRILKKFQLNNCSAMKKLNVSQCPKLNICALVAPVMSLTTDSFFLVSYEPCMQNYHPGEGEKAILSRTRVNQSVLLCHDFCDISHEGIQANFKQKIFEWFRYLQRFHIDLNYVPDKLKRKKWKSETYQFSEYPWSHDLRKMHGQYSYSPSSDFCGTTEGQYQLVTNNPIFGDIFETHQLDSGFPGVTDCDAFRDSSLISYEVVEKYFQMRKKFVGFYIPITENNRLNF